MRAYPPSGDKLNVIGVSIDPTPEGLERLRQTLASVGRNMRPGDDVRLAATLREALGLQTVSVQGISPKSHFAQVLVEADYRMKLIGIGLEQPAREDSQLRRSGRCRERGPQRAATLVFRARLQVRARLRGRTRHADGRLGREAGRASRKLVQEGGVRQQSGGESKASKEFCTAFTEQYPKLADVEPVYAELRNLIDMSVAAAFIQEKDYYRQANWDLGVFADEAQFPIDTFETPKQVESARECGLERQHADDAHRRRRARRAAAGPEVRKRHAGHRGQGERMVRQSLAQGPARRSVVVGLVARSGRDLIYRSGGLPSPPVLDAVSHGTAVDRTGTDWEVRPTYACRTTGRLGGLSSLPACADAFPSLSQVPSDPPARRARRTHWCAWGRS